MIDSAVDEMMQAGIIEKSDNLWCFPIVLVEKKDRERDSLLTSERLIKLQKIRSSASSY